MKNLWRDKKKAVVCDKINRIVGFFVGKELIRWVLVSWVATLVDFGFVWSFVDNFNYIWVVFFWFFLWTLVNFGGYSFWVFGHSKKIKGSNFSGFFIISVLWVGIWILIVWWCVEFFGLQVLYAKIVSLVVVFFFNFVLRKFLFYRV